MKAKTQSILLLGGLIAFAALLPDLNAVADQNVNIERTLSLDTGYRNTAYSNRAITDFNMEILQGYGYLNDGFYSWQNEIGKNDSTFAKLSWETTNIGIGIILNGIFRLPLHEFGHGSRVAAAGGTPTYSYIATDGTKDSTTNIFSYYLLSVENSFTSFVVADAETSSDLNTQPEFIALSALEQRKIYFEIAAGGLNNEMYFAEEMSNMIDDRGGHVSYLVPYVVAKNSSFIYDKGGTSSDKDNLLSYYNAKGYNITADDIDLDNIIAFLASGTTYSMLSGYYNYFNNQDPTFKLFSFYNFRVPDLYLYHTTKGLSFKLDSVYQVNNFLSIPFSFEYVHRGESYLEPSIGFKISFPKWSSSVKIFVSDRVSSQSSVTFHMSDVVDVSLGWRHFNRDTLFGERHTLDYYAASSDEIWSKLSLKY